jgi:hypothetical protein
VEGGYHQRRDHRDSTLAGGPATAEKECSLVIALGMLMHLGTRTVTLYGYGMKVYHNGEQAATAPHVGNANRYCVTLDQTRNRAPNLRVAGGFRSGIQHHQYTRGKETRPS